MSQHSTELLRGKGAHVDPVACLEDIDANISQRRIEIFPHSIADLIFHMNYWMNYELKRIRGEKPNYPDHNSESFPTEPQDWTRLKRDFAGFLSEFEKLAKSTDEELGRQIESIHEGDKKVSSTLEAIVLQIIAHNSYHTGQIVMLRQSLKAWPPKSGGDTW